MFAAADERVAASIVSSTSGPKPLRPLAPGYFHRMFVERAVGIDPAGIQPIAGAPEGMLVAPRPMWIIDGRDDRGIDPEKRAEWRRVMQEGRDSIRRIYEILGASEKFDDTWFEGGHCGGMTVANAVHWFRRWFAES